MSAVAVKEHPILFTDPMARAILAGTKTQTRRICKPQPLHLKGSGQRVYADADFKKAWEHVEGMGESLDPYRDCPYGRPGDRLWVRETWGYTAQCDDINGPGDVIAYRAGAPWHVHEGKGSDHRLRKTKSGALMRPNHFCYPPQKWKPSIHMPRWASRLTLDITEVRVERLQDISGDDAVAEGIQVPVSPDGFPLIRISGDNPVTRFVDLAGAADPDKVFRAYYASLWCDINGPASWEENPWVWVISFKRVET